MQVMSDDSCFSLFRLRDFVSLFIYFGLLFSQLPSFTSVNLILFVDCFGHLSISISDFNEVFLFVFLQAGFI